MTPGSRIRGVAGSRRRALAALLLLLGLAACGSREMGQAIGVGRGDDELKLSPCYGATLKPAPVACITLPNRLPPEFSV